MTGRVASKIKLSSVDELLGVPEMAGTIDKLHFWRFMQEAEEWKIE